MTLRNFRAFEKKSFIKSEGYPSISINVFTFDAIGTIVHMQISYICEAELDDDILFYKIGDNSHYIYIS